MKLFKRLLLLLFCSITVNYGFAQELSLIPKPNQISYSKGVFPIKKVKYIYYPTDSLKTEALALQEALSKSAVKVQLTKDLKLVKAPFIQLEINSSIANREAYDLNINPQKLLVKASTKAGIFYAIQTLKQFNLGATTIPTVKISDEPAFAWRGYMVDVGRNYQTMALLKQQIDVMSRYKLNVFHMHLTEDVAWRIEVKKYPALTKPEFMERNKGQFYSTAEIKELIQYCKDRNILFMPEIDMPGHSRAFTRAMGVDMQSDEGLAIVKDVLKELIDTYDFPYIHIGADEVKITKQNFLPEVSALLISLKRKVMGWEPGGNYAPSTIRQLWMDEAFVVGNNTKMKYVDSRHLYVNHMDPLESVVTIFNRQLALVNKGNDEALGAILCSWPDRRVAHEEDVMRMNAIYPNLLTFAERSWKGSGYPMWVANATSNGNEAFNLFKEFENRLLDHKKKYFKNLIFPYEKQADVNWKLYGPYNNEGDLTKKFEPENASFDIDKVKESQDAIGATIILRHFWAPKIKAVIENPKENTTYYAFRKIWADKDETRKFWIGFHNISRSHAEDSRPVGEWDNHHSAVWVNNQLIAPPVWKNAGKKGDLELPLTDENYENRAPTEIKLKKGWNTVKIKAPIGSFKGKRWDKPEKWMFTFVEVTK